MDGDLDKLAELIFVGNTRPIASVQLTGDFDDTRDLFEALLMMFTKGMRLLFAQDGQVELSNLTRDNFTEFTNKFQAIGITPSVLKYHIYQLLQLQGGQIDVDIIQEWETTKHLYPETIPLETLVDYSTTTSKNLTDYYFQFKSENHYYIVSFMMTAC